MKHVLIRYLPILFIQIRFFFTGTIWMITLNDDYIMRKRIVSNCEDSLNRMSLKKTEYNKYDGYTKIL